MELLEKDPHETLMIRIQQVSMQGMRLRNSAITYIDEIAEADRFAREQH